MVLPLPQYDDGLCDGDDEQSPVAVQRGLEGQSEHPNDRRQLAVVRFDERMGNEGDEGDEEGGVKECQDVLIEDITT